MSNQWQARRGTTAQNDAFTGASGEITYDTDSQGLRVHDGTKQGGYLVDTVVEYQKPTAENNYTWYRLYASGWVEQGGILVVASSGVAITLPIVMANNTYGCLATAISDISVDGVGLQMYGRTTTLFYLRNKNYGSSLSIGATWQVSGMAA